MPLEDQQIVDTAGIPQLDDIASRRGQVCPVGAKTHIADLAWVSLERQQVLAGDGIPHLHLAGLVELAAARGDPGAVGGKADAVSPVGVSLDGHDLLTRLCVPELYGSVPAGRGEARAVGVEGHAPDTVRVALQRAKLLAGVCVPQLYG